MKTKPEDKNEKDILLKMLELTQKNGLNFQDRSEKRVAFFITISTATVAYFIHEPETTKVIILFILLCYGIETLQYINWIKIHQEIDKIPDQLIKKSLSDFSPTLSEIQTESKKNQDATEKFTIRGGLAEFMYLSNSFLLVGIIYAIMSMMNSGPVCQIVVSAFSFPVFIIFQYLVSKKIRDIVKK